MAAAALIAPARTSRRLGLTKHRRVRGTTVLVAAAAVALVSVAAAPALLPVCLVAAATVVSRLRRRRRTRGRRHEVQALAAGLDVLVGELKVGAHPISAFAVAGAEAGGPVGRSLQAVATRAGLGADVAQGIRAMSARSAAPDYWRRLAVFWHLAAEHGLAMSTLMRAAHRDIVDRQRFDDRMNAALAGARATAVILASLPVLGVVLGQLIGADPVGFLLGGGLGGVLLMVGVTLICAGILWADRIVDRMAA